MSMETPPPPSHVVIAYDATKDRGQHELDVTVRGIRVRGDILHGGDTLVVLGVLHGMTHPMRYNTPIESAGHFSGISISAMEEEVSKKVDVLVNMLHKSAEECQDEGVSIEVKVTAGSPLKKVIVQEVVTCNAAWVILDRHLRRDLRFYLKQIPCKVALIQDDLSVQVLRTDATNEPDNLEHKLFYSMSKVVPLSNAQGSENNEQSIISCKSFSLALSSLESYDTLKSALFPSSTNKSREHNSLSLEFGSSSNEEKSGISDGI